MPPSSRPWTASMFLPLLSLLALQPIHSSEYHYPTDLKCQDLHGAASGCSVSFPGWREDTLVPTSELVCSVAIQASIRSYPLTCPSYQLQQIQISKPSSPYKQSLAYSTPPSNIKTCKHFSDLSLHLEHSNQTDLMDQWFCPYGIQPESCENSAPQLDITTAAWNATQCAQESCGDGYPLSLNVNLIVRTLPKSSCPTADTVHNQPCSGTMDRSDNLPRGHCGCRTLYHGDQQGPLLTCTCAYGYFGQSCQAECPAGTFVPGQSGLANCCSGHGTPSATVLKSNEVLVVCKCHLGWGGEACATAMPCAAGTYGPNCDQVCSCNGIGNQPDGACDKDTGLCLCLSDHWNAGCTDCNSKRAFGPTCMSQCPACDGTGAVAPGACHSGVHGDGTCACKGIHSGWNEGCTNCKTNVYGPNCDQQCNCTRVEHASCLSAGIHGTGGCGCTPPFNHALDGTCNNCQPGYFGRHCEECTCNSGSTTNHEQCNDGYNGTGSCICRPGWSGPDCKQSTNDDGGKIPFWVVPVVAVALVIVGFILFFVLYKRQNKIFRGGSSRSATNSPWNSQTSGLMRGRSVDLTRPLLSPQSSGINSSRGSTNSPRNRYPTANIATVAVNSSPTMNKRGRTNSGLMNMMDLLLDSDDAGTRHHRRSSAHRIVEQFDKLLLSTSNGGGGFDYTIDYSMLSMGVKIGSGASGEVFTATVDPQNNTEEPIVVAVKRLYADTVDKDYFVSAFRRELHILRRMDHQNVVRLIGVSISPDNHYHIVTELCRCALNDLLERGKGRLPDHLLANINSQMVAGMKYLHDNSIVHRDLKPANCLIMGGGQSGELVVKICDFGLSRLVVHDVTMMTAEIGTPAYMAPEMASENELDSVEAGKAIDVYSYAICCLEIWTQDRPYKNKKLNAFQLMVKVMKGQRPIIPTNQLPPNVETMIRLCWSQEPGSRPSFVSISKSMEQNDSFFDVPRAKEGEGEGEGEEEEEEEEEEERPEERPEEEKAEANKDATGLSKINSIGKNPETENPETTVDVTPASL